MNLLDRAYRRLDASLRARILLPTAVLFAVTLTAMVAGAVHFYGEDMERGRRERAELFAGMVAGAVSNVMLSGHPNEVPALFDTLVAHSSDLLAASLVSPSGHISASSSPALLGAMPWGNPGKLTRTTVVSAPEGRRAE